MGKEVGSSAMSKKCLQCGYKKYGGELSSDFLGTEDPSVKKAKTLLNIVLEALLILISSTRHLDCRAK